MIDIGRCMHLELMLLAGIALGLAISSVARSIDQATMLMFPAMLIQVILSGLLFDVGPVAYLAFTHWGVQALGNSADVAGMFSGGGKAGDPSMGSLDLARDPLTLLGFWAVLLLFTVGLAALTCWRQGRSDKARIPDD